MSVTNNKLAVLSNKFSKYKIMFYFIVKNNSQSYTVLIFFGYVGHHHILLATRLQPKITTFRKTLNDKQQWLKKTMAHHLNKQLTHFSPIVQENFQP